MLSCRPLHGARIEPAWYAQLTNDLWEKLVMAYALLETDRARFITADRLPALTPLPAKEAEGLKEAYFNLGRLRRKLVGGGGGWLDEQVIALEKE
jgi:hypothetical protein